MQFMVELIHGPETCIAGRKGEAAHHAEMMAGLRDIAREHNLEVVEGWAFPVGHRLWYVVESKDSQSVADAFFAADVHQWNTVQIHPVLNHATFTETVLKPIIGNVELAS